MSHLQQTACDQPDGGLGSARPGRPSLTGLRAPDTLGLVLFACLGLVGCAADPPPPFGDRVLIDGTILLSPEPLDLPLPDGGIRSEGGFDALCMTLSEGHTLATDAGATGCRIARADGERFPLEARFALAEGALTPRTCHQSTILTMGTPRTKVCFRNPGVPPDGSFVYTGIRLSAGAEVAVERIEWRDAPGDAGRPNVW